LDLANAHVVAVERIDEVLGEIGDTSTVINVGTGRRVIVASC
jgi:UDP-glucose 4-epimerase